MNGRTNRYVIISTHDFIIPIRGGGGLRTLSVAREFKKRGCKVTIIAPTDRVSEIDGINIDWLYPPRKQRSQILSSVKFNIRLFKKLIKFIPGLDLIVMHNTIAAATIPFLKMIFRFKFMLDITDIHAEYLLIGRRNIFEKLLTPFILRFEYFIIKSADFITVATREMRKLLIFKGIEAGKIAVVYDGVDKENIPQEKEDGAEKGIIHLGAIDRQHGLDVFIHAIPYILAEMPDVKFYFVGGGRELVNMKNLAVKLGCMNSCIFTDCLLQEEAREFLKKAAVGVIPRRNVLSNRIITTLKIFEYWASHTAVVATRFKGIEEVAIDKENIIYFQSGNFEDLAEKLIFLLKDEIVREKLIKTGVDTVNNFNISALASKIVDFALQ